MNLVHQVLLEYLVVKEDPEKLAKKDLQVPWGLLVKLDQLDLLVYQVFLVNADYLAYLEQTD